MLSVYQISIIATVMQSQDIPLGQIQDILTRVQMRMVEEKTYKAIVRVLDEDAPFTDKKVWLAK